MSSRPEDRFVDRFAEVFGVESACLLAHEFPVLHILGNGRLIDYALGTVDERVAFEIDGLTWHVPDAERTTGYEDQILRQNSLVHQGWRVLRWTDRQIADEPESVKEQLALFLERIPGLLALDDFLPRQHGEVIEMKPHHSRGLEPIRVSSAIRGPVQPIRRPSGPTAPTRPSVRLPAGSGPAGTPIGPTLRSRPSVVGSRQ
jgi:very-short-patch-repair endonuclease